MMAREFTPGQWIMEDSYQRPYAVITFVKRGGELGYRVQTWAQESDGRKIVGYFTSLRGAASAVHGMWINRGVPTRPDAGSNRATRGDDPWAN